MKKKIHTLEELRPVDPAHVKNVAQAWKKLHSGTIPEITKTLNLEINVLAGLVEAVADAKIKIEPWQYFSQTLIGKIIYTSQSLTKLCEGHVYEPYLDKREKLKIVDINSIFVLVRSLIECYTTLYYIYNKDLPKEDQLFRFRLLQHAELKSSRNMSDHFDSYPKEMVDLLAREKIQLDEIEKEIRKMPHFDKLTSDQKRKFNGNYGLARLFSWAKMIENSNLKNDIYQTLHSLYSNHAHSEYISLAQLSQLSMNSGNTDLIRFTRTSLMFVKMILSLSIEYVTENYTSAEITFNSYPSEIRSEIWLWQIAGRKTK